MKKLSRNKALDYLRAYNNSNATSIGDVYGTASCFKWRAERDIKDAIAMDDTAYGYRVLSHNSNYFTAGYLKDLADGVRLVIETHANTYYYDFLSENA